ncbi:MAG: Mur ligase domain-containing protein [Elusimicrobiota bacterium]
MSLSVNHIVYNRLHFAGILGSGMSAIAQYLCRAGLKISGSDRLIDDDATQRTRSALVSAGCRIHPQDGSGVTLEMEALVVSTAIEENNSDIVNARALGIPILHRADVLAAIVATKRTVAVTGTSGKSTVTALIFHLLRACGKDPSLITGAGLNSLSGNGALGNSFNGASDLLVIEADESDGSLVKYKPFISVFLNASKDHKPVDVTLGYFQTLARRSAHVFVSHEDASLRALTAAKTFGLAKEADFHPDKLEANRESVTLIKDKTRFTLPFPGKHNAQNLLAALQVCRFLGCQDTTSSDATRSYKGIERRWDRIETAKGITVIDDYAHNPEKIAAVLTTVQDISPRVIAVFQPHGFGPTRFLLDDYIATFNRMMRPDDVLYLLPIYYAGGTAAKDVSSDDIAAGLTAGKTTVLTPRARDMTPALIAAAARPGDIVISMGARDPSLPGFAKSIARAIDAKA